MGANRGQIKRVGRSTDQPALAPRWLTMKTVVQSGTRSVARIKQRSAASPRLAGGIVADVCRSAAELAKILLKGGPVLCCTCCAARCTELDHEAKGSR